MTCSDIIIAYLQRISSVFVQNLSYNITFVCLNSICYILLCKLTICKFKKRQIRSKFDAFYMESG
nr:MAG TPA: hypothetical protein [Caudoviricetes sp.]